MTGWNSGIGSVPFGRWARLTAMAERLRADDWPVANSLQERTEADPDIESVLDLLPAPAPHEVLPMGDIPDDSAPEATTTVVDDDADH